MVNTYIQANTDGRLHAASEPSISPLNRGFLYGDAIYEVWRTLDGIVFTFEEHWKRLEGSARALHMTLPFTRDELFAQIRRTAAAFFKKVGAKPELYIRLQVTRGCGTIGLDIALADRASYVLLVQSLKEVPAEKRAKGLKLGLATELHRNHPLTLNPAWKTGNYLNNILCLREALARGADEVLITNLKGEITEAAVSNVFFVRGETVVTPRLDAGILAGITRRFILDRVAPRAGFKVKEATVRLKDLAAFDECFITGTTKGIAPVCAIDAHKYRVSRTTVTARLSDAYADTVKEHIAQHGELNVI
ncbi:MAG: aminotransferase class IV family protein [Verrucomicrobia bacterium]|nr:aminotransferase class IV family protein [Verrucomicrobiota bacterium]